MLFSSSTFVSMLPLSMIAFGSVSQDPVGAPPDPLLRGDVVWRSTIEPGWRAPSSAIHAANGDLLVADPAQHSVRMIRVGQDGVQETLELPRPADLTGFESVWSPDSLARGLDGTVLVADSRGRRIDRFAAASDAAGGWTWLELVDLGDESVAPRALAETAQGLFVVDGTTDRLAVRPRGAEGGVSLVWLDESLVPGGWGRPVDLAAAADGRLFVADADGHRILRLDAAGAYLGSFGERGPFPGLFQEPAGLDLAGGRLFVADRLNHRISIFDLEGRSRGQWGMHAVIPRQGEGRIHYPVDVAVSLDARRAAVVEPFERRVQLFDSAEQSVDGPGTVAELPSLDGVTSHFGSGVAADGDLVVLWEPETAAVVVFDWRDEVPIHVTSFGGPGAAPDRFGRITAGALDGVRQRIALADPGLDRLAIVDLDRDPEGGLRLDPFMGRAAGTISFERIAAQISALGETPPPDAALEPVDLAWLDGGGLAMLEARVGRILVLAPMPAARADAAPLPGELVALWGPQGSGGAKFDRPVAMAASPARDALAVLDAGGANDAARIVVLSLDGIPRHVVELPRVVRSDDEHPLDPAGLAWTPEGFVVSDRLADRLLLFDDDGTLRHEVGTTGVADGAMWSPQGLAVRPDGTVLVVDTGNHRVQGFDGADGEWRIVFSLGRASTRKRVPPAGGVGE